MKLLLALALWIGSAPGGDQAAPGDVVTQHEPYLYEVVLLRAAPGRLLDLIERYQARMAAFQGAGQGTPHMMRHSQGDQWDLLILVPMGDFGSFFSPERAAGRREALEAVGGTGPEWAAHSDSLVAWREELFAWGPPPVVVDERFGGARFYHVEMFVALPGKREALVEQREMENEFLRAIGRPDNLIFTRAAGAEWDTFTLGFYRDLQHFAERSQLAPEDEDEAARAAGFEAANRIGTYLRTLIAYHNDTLAVAVD